RSPSDAIPWATRLKASLVLIGAAALASLSGGFMIWTLVPLFNYWQGAHGLWHVMSFGAPMFVTIFSLVMLLQIGLLGRNFPDERREWFSRLGAWLLIYDLGWIGLFTLAVYAPRFIVHMMNWAEIWAAPGFILIWMGSTAAGILAGKSPVTGALVAAGR